MVECSKDFGGVSIIFYPENEEDAKIMQTMIEEGEKKDYGRNIFANAL